MFQPDLLAGKRILITGGGTGLGKSMARHLLELGAEVAICGKVILHNLDIRDLDAVEAMMTDLFEERPLDGLINNAAGNILARSEDLSP